MKGLRRVSTFVCAVLVAHAAAAQSIARPALRDELLLRARIDQSLRGDLGMTSDAIDKARWARIRVVDEGNTRWMHTVLARDGWPSKAMVGPDGVQAAWLLVQHADRDPAFQRECLALIEALGEGEVAEESKALLTDRVRLAQHQPQIYGSQVRGDCTRGFEVLPLEDAAHVDERRAGRGMPPMAAYLEQIRSLFCSPSPNP